MSRYCDDFTNNISKALRKFNPLQKKYKKIFGLRIAKIGNVLTLFNIKS